MREIGLTQGKVAIVSDRDYSHISRHKWYAQKSGNTFYAARHLPEENNKIILMHTAILGRKDRLVTDHINGNGLDNRRCNLRLVTHRENMRNYEKHRKNPVSLGTTRHKCGKFQAQVKMGKTVKYIGLFDTIEEAHQSFRRFNLKQEL